MRPFVAPLVVVALFSSLPASAEQGVVWQADFAQEDALTSWSDSAEGESRWRVLPSAAERTGVLASPATKDNPSLLRHSLPAVDHCFALQVRLRTHSNETARGVSFGLSDGDPNAMHGRVCQVGLLPSRSLSVFDGEKWAAVSTYPTDQWIDVQVVCDLRVGAMEVYLGDKRVSDAPLNLCTQVRPDSVFLSNQGETDGAAQIRVDEVAIRNMPELAAARNVRLDIRSGTEIALEWTLPQADSVKECRVYRDGQLVGTVAPGRGLYVDRTVKPSTWYEYSVAAVLPDGREGVRNWPIAALTRPGTEPRLSAPSKFDVVVLGATPSGIAAAIGAARRGKTVALVSPELWIGGMMTGGLSRTDFGHKDACGGLFREFMDAVYEHYVTTYGEDSPQAKVCRGGFYFEPKLAREIFTRWLDSYPSITVFRQHLLRHVYLEDGAVTGILVFDKRRYVRKRLVGKAFVDATYEGDLAAMAGAQYRIGREGRDDEGESFAGELYWDVWQRKIVGGSGAGDRKVQAYNYRLCLTRKPSNRVMPPPPMKYDRDRYVNLIRDINNGKLKSLKMVIDILQLPNGKADANNHPQGDPSSDFIGGNFDYPEANYKRREEIAQAHIDHVLGLLYFLQNDPEVPEEFRNDARQWGFPRDEFTDNGNFPTQLYVREARRIVGEHLFTQHDALLAPGSSRPPLHRDSIAVGAYSMDSHATSHPKPDKPYELEGFFYTKASPYHIPYRCLVPKGIDGLLVSCCLSSTHIGYGTLRMEPVWVATGQSAGTACALAIDAGVSVREVDIDTLQRELVNHGQVISLLEDVPPAHPHFAAMQFFGTRGFFDGYKGEPDQPVTRRTAAKWLWLWLKDGEKAPRENVTGGPHYTDVPPTDHDYVLMESLRHVGIGPGDAFHPDAPLTDAELAAWLAALRLPHSAPVKGAAAVTRGELCTLLYATPAP